MKVPESSSTPAKPPKSRLRRLSLIGVNVLYTHADLTNEEACRQTHHCAQSLRCLAAARGKGGTFACGSTWDAEQLQVCRDLVPGAALGPEVPAPLLAFSGAITADK